MRFEELNWFEVEGFLKQDDRLILVLGACEQHGYLSLLTDVKVPQALADAASKQSGVLVAPPLNYGVSPYFLAYPGTISLRISTFLDVVEDVLRSVYRQGFRRILVLNGHGGNTPGKARVQELANELPDLRVIWHAWWLSERVQEIARKHNLAPSHANWLEAFPFTRLVEMPEGEKPAPHSNEVLEASAFREVFGDGTFGGHYLAPEGVMDEIFKAALDEVLTLLKFEA